MFNTDDMKSGPEVGVPSPSEMTGGQQPAPANAGDAGDSDDGRDAGRSGGAGAAPQQPKNPDAEAKGRASNPAVYYEPWQEPVYRQAPGQGALYARAARQLLCRLPEGAPPRRAPRQAKRSGWPWLLKAVCLVLVLRGRQRRGHIRRDPLHRQE